MSRAHDWLAKIHALPRQSKVKIMNVCGGHERAITQAGLRTALPDYLEIIPGPGCPVCVCPEEDVFSAIQLALNEDIILLAFGDMLRVPVNVGKNEVRTLAQAKAQGADIRPIASPLEARGSALQQPDKKVVFFVAGFETTTAPVAAMLLEAAPANLSLLLSGRLTWPAVALLLASEDIGFDALIAPGHVSAVMGAEEWHSVVAQHHIPTAVAGFSPDSLLAAIYSVLRQRLENHVFLDNCYPQVVHQGGNRWAKAQLAAVMDVVDAPWRGIGVIPRSGFALKTAYAAHDARLLFPSYADASRRRAGQMPAGCDCAKVVLGKRYPNQCALFGQACTPRNPIGPCMVSDEGACRIWWSAGLRHHLAV
jgi:hydrogenase expression/formation protein HypD